MLHAITVNDLNGDTLTVTISATHAEISLSQNTGLSFSSGDGLQDDLMVFSGTIADINAALDGLIYNSNADFYGNAILSLNVSDGQAQVTGGIAVAVAGETDGVSDQIVTDVGHDTSTPMINKIKQGSTKCGDGPILTYGPAVQNNLLDLIISVAEKKKIPFQRAAASRSTGTDTDAFAYAKGGVASSLISLPLRYMHTTVETVHRDDVENVILLIYECLKVIKNKHDFRYVI